MSAAALALACFFAVIASAAVVRRLDRTPHREDSDT